MTSYHDMQRLAHDPAAVRALACGLLALPDSGWTEWELDFLDHMARFAGPEPLTTRQREVLVELRDGARTYSRLDGFSIASLVRDCSLAAADLSEDDAAFVQSLKASGTVTLKHRPAMRLLRCSRELGLVDRLAAAG